ncbi:hypothetical protein CHS0354_033135 [Potamilus streckersoni]|uniref:Uncharacterized protein n=1 Tax=Potamilus streckersoni TaxID=2493646 RepID=A0AAE0S6C3_9BIVA|nr:hypothetical protein CHS0354_033135 [Potamilus streckersoni]
MKCILPPCYACESSDEEKDDREDEGYHSGIRASTEINSNPSTSGAVASGTVEHVEVEMVELKTETVALAPPQRKIQNMYMKDPCKGSPEDRTACTSKRAGTPKKGKGKEKATAPKGDRAVLLHSDLIDSASDEEESNKETGYKDITYIDIEDVRPECASQYTYISEDNMELENSTEKNETAYKIVERKGGKPVNIDDKDISENGTQNELGKTYINIPHVKDVDKTTTTEGLESSQNSVKKARNSPEMASYVNSNVLFVKHVTAVVSGRESETAVVHFEDLGSVGSVSQTPEYINIAMNESNTVCAPNVDRNIPEHEDSKRACQKESSLESAGKAANTGNDPNGSIDEINQNDKSTNGKKGTHFSKHGIRGDCVKNSNEKIDGKYKVDFKSKTDSGIVDKGTNKTEDKAHNLE